MKRGTHCCMVTAHKIGWLRSKTIRPKRVQVPGFAPCLLIRDEQPF